MTAALLVSSLGGSFASETGLDTVYVFQAPPTGRPAVTYATTPNINLVNAQPVAGYPSTNYSVVWSGSITAPMDGDYTFSMTVDDNGRLWVGEKWIDTALSYNGSAARTVTGVATLKKGVPTPILMRMWQSLGLSQATLEWSGPGLSRQVVPSSALSPSGWTRIDAPASSYESPVSVICHHRPSAQPVISATPAQSMIGQPIQMGQTSRLAEVTLLPSSPVVVSVNGRGEAATKSIQWTTTDFAAPPSRITMRMGSTLLVKPHPGGTLYISSGYDRSPAQTVSVGNGRYQVRFTSSGDFFLDDDLPNGIRIPVKVLGLDVASSLVHSTMIVGANCEVGSAIPLIPLNGLPLITAGSFEHSTVVELGDLTNSQRLFGVKLYSAGETSRGYLRIGEAGPIIATVPVTGYNLRTDPAFIDIRHADGSTSGISHIYMWPFFHNLSLNVTMRSHTATFLGGADHFTIKTDGTPSSIGEPGFTAVQASDGRTVGRFTVRVNFPPGETKWCFTADPTQIAP